MPTKTETDVERTIRRDVAVRMFVIGPGLGVRLAWEIDKKRAA